MVAQSNGAVIFVFWGVHARRVRSPEFTSAATVGYSLRLAKTARSATYAFNFYLHL